mgnify:CR=1 FL=1
MSDLAASIFDGLNALFTADTASGGLNENSDSGVARVRHFVRRGDPNYETDRIGNWPMVVVEVFNAENRAFAARHAISTVRMHLFTLRDSNTSSFTVQNAVADRIYTVFDGAQMSAQGEFTFSLLNLLRDFQAQSSGTELHKVFEFSVYPQVAAA